MTHPNRISRRMLLRAGATLSAATALAAILYRTMWRKYTMDV